jgi:hypothetical protein
MQSVRRFINFLNKLMLMVLFFLPNKVICKPVIEWVKSDEFNTKLNKNKRLDLSDGYGQSLDANDQTIVVGATGYNLASESGGAVFVYEGYGSDSLLEQIITPKDHRDYSRFGKSVSIHEKTIVVGDYSHPTKGSSSGTVYIFEKQEDEYKQVKQLFASDADKDDQFGISVGIEDKAIVVGAIGDQDKGNFTGSAYLFIKNKDGNYKEIKLSPSELHKGSAFGASVAINKGTIIIGAPYHEGKGAVFVYNQSPSGEYEYLKLTPSNLASSFGYSVDIENGVIVVGAYGGPGSVYVYNLEGEKYIETILKADDEKGGEFGHDVSIHDGNILTGKHQDSSVDEHVGSAYYFENHGDNKYIQFKLIPEDVVAGETFGKYIKLVGNNIFVSIPGMWNAISGRVYMYNKSNKKFKWD